MALPVVTDCAVCARALRDYFELRRNGLRTSACRHCGLVLVTNSPINERNIAEFYSMEAYRGERALQDTDLYSGYYDNCFAGYDENDLTVRQFRNILATIHRLLARPKPGGALLDIGCATGVFLDLARKSGFEVKGIEVSPDLAEYARQSFGLEVGSDLMSAAYPAASFDAVTLNDVIEHLPAAILQPMTAEIARILKPGGVLEIRTPGEDGLLRAIAKALYFGSFKAIEAPMHLFYSFEHLLNFTPRALEMLLEPFDLALAISRREEENPARLNLGTLGRAALRLSYVASAAMRRQHKIVLYFRKPGHD